jgi:hypothetical protein
MYRGDAGIDRASLIHHRMPIIAPEPPSRVRVSIQRCHDIPIQYLVPYAQLATPSTLALDQVLAKNMWDWCENELEAY